ncbi:MAG TPA: iron ABC transporter permease [Kosmotogaceae bacterium]|nr:MAG: Binding-protein-dependent transport systems inner membrane component [Thermotogales bacterium 46_20]HAA85136.1 iron ABC transporter permease [Kosmotogaceae bacterium]
MRSTGKLVWITAGASLAFLFVAIVWPVFGSFTFGELSSLVAALTSPSVIRILRFTLFQALLSTGLCLVIGIPAAYYYGRFRGTLSDFLSNITFIPFFMPSISMVIGFLVMYGRNGIVNSFLNILGIGPIQILYTFGAILMGHVFYNSPILIRILGSALRNVPPSVIENARIDGSSYLKTFLFVELPLVMPALIASTILIFSYCFTSFAVVLILGGSQYATLEVAIYMYLRLLARPEIAVALACVQFGFIFAFGLTMSFLEKRESFEYEGSYIRKSSRLFYYIVFYVLFQALPVAAALLGSILDLGRMQFVFSGLLDLFRGESVSLIGTTVARALSNSLLLSLTASILGVAIAFAVAWSSRRARVGNRLMRIASLLCISVTPAILSLGYTIQYRQVHASVLMVMLYIVVSFPVALNLVYSHVSSLDLQIIDAARVDGACSRQILLRIIFPIVRNTLIAAAMVIFAVSMGEFAGSLILGGDRLPTVTVAIYRMLSGRQILQSRVLSALVLIIVISVMIIVTKITADGQREVQSTDNTL